jgi:hypothetical protein
VSEIRAFGTFYIETKCPYLCTANVRSCTCTFHVCSPPSYKPDLLVSRTKLSKTTDNPQHHGFRITWRQLEHHRFRFIRRSPPANRRWSSAVCIIHAHFHVVNAELDYSNLVALHKEDVSVRSHLQCWAGSISGSIWALLR